MFATTLYTPAVHVPKHREAYPWPQSEYQRELTEAYLWFLSTLKPPRPFPAANYCPLSARPKPKTIRISTDRIPVLTPEQWERWCMRDWQQADPLPPVRVPRKRGRFERFLDRLIDIRTGKYKILPDWHVFFRAPYTMPEPDPKPQDESWLT